MIKNFNYEGLNFTGEQFSLASGFCSFVFQNYIYILGIGETSKRATGEIFRIKLGQENIVEKVQVEGPIPYARMGMASSFSPINNNSIVYFFGGIGGNQHIYSNQMFQLDLQKNTWQLTNNPSLNPSGRSDHSMVCLKDKVVIFGGIENKRIMNDTNIYDPKQQQWTSVDHNSSQMYPSFRFGHSGVAINSDNMLVSGGYDGNRQLNDLWNLNLSLTSTNSNGKNNQGWSQIDAKGQVYGLFKHSTVIYKHLMIVYGGYCDNGQQISESIFVLNTNYFEWMSIFSGKNAILATGMMRAMHESLLIDNDLYIVGGFNGAIMKNDIFKIKIEDIITTATKETPTKNGDTEQDDNFQTYADLEDSFIHINQFSEWKQQKLKGPSFSPRTGHAVVAIGDQFYLFGGSDNENILNDLYVYSLLKKSWSGIVPSTPPEIKPHARSGAQATQGPSSDEIYIFGGYTYRKGEYFQDLWRFDLVTLKWSEVKLEPQDVIIQARVDHSMVLHNQYAFIFGGSNGTNQFNDLIRINLEQREVKFVQGDGDPPSPRFGHTADSFRNTMYIFGGWNGTDTLDELYTYSYISNFWYEEQLVSGSRPPSRYRHASSVIGNSMYICGGVDRKQQRFDDLFEYNFEKRLWTYIEVSGKAPSPRTFHQMVRFENSLFIIGGNDGKNKNNDIHSINVADSMMCDQSSIFEGGNAAEVRDDQSAFHQDTKDQLMFIDESIKKSGSFDYNNKFILVLRQQVMELSQRLKEEQSRNICMICKEKQINAVFLDCGHRCLCYQCSGKLQNCPICNKPPARVVQIFMV